MAEHHNETKKYSKEFGQMKSLVGTWAGNSDMGQGPENFEVQYRLLSGGSVIEERTFPGTPKEMVTKYHDKNGTLSLVHCCMLGNQPALLAKKSSKKSIEFDFDPSCAVDPKKEMHMHSLTLKLNDDGSLTQAWTVFANGEAQEQHPFDMSGPAITKHQRALENAGLVHRHRDGPKRILELDTKPMDVANQWMQHHRKFWEGSLDALADYLERGVTNQSKKKRKPKPDK